MTKLLEWLSGGVLFLGVWSALLYNPTDSIILNENKFYVFLLPVIAIGLFGIYAASVVLYRVVTFNICEEAAEELQNEIRMAMEDLKRRGFIIKDTEEVKE